MPESRSIHLAVRGAKTAPHRVAGWAALAAPLTMWVMFLVLGLTRPGYNMLTNAASELGAQGTQNAQLFDVGFFFAGGVLTVVLGIGLLTLHKSWLWRLGSAMVVVAGSFLFLSGVFPTSGASHQAAQLHGFFSQWCFAIAALSPFPLLAGAHPELLPLSIRRFWAGTAVMALLIEGFNVFLLHRVHLPQGAFQRPFLLTLTVWFVATGAWLLRHRPAHMQPAAVNI